MKSPVFIACLLAASSCIQAQTKDQPERYTFSVHGLNAVELPKDTSQEWMGFFGPGLASGALGAVAPPMFASGLIVGGLLLAPSAVIISGIERKKWQQVTNALKSISFEPELLRALQARAASVLPRGTGPGANVELIVNAYGVVGTRPERACFVASVDLVMVSNGKDVLRDRLIISEADRSADAPPAQCASLDRFAERDGELVRETTAEYSEVLATMAIDRILASTRL